jgi:F-type H+-transporting ATPase subunit delta
MISVAGVRYAKALVEIVAAPGSTVDPPKALAELKSVSEVISTSPQLRNALLSPAVSASRKRAVIARIAGPLGISKIVQNFCFVVIDHRRVVELPAMLEAFELLLDERLGFVRADVASARELNDAQRAALQAELSRLSGKKAKLRFTTDPTLVAGAVARVGSRTYDGSVRGQLDRLRAKLASQ